MECATLLARLRDLPSGVVGPRLRAPLRLAVSLLTWDTIGCGHRQIARPLSRTRVRGVGDVEGRPGRDVARGDSVTSSKGSGAAFSKFERRGRGNHRGSEGEAKRGKE